MVFVSSKIVSFKIVESFFLDAYTNARALCETNYEKYPELRLQCINTVEEGVTAKMVYVPSHLFHISFELFKVQYCTKLAH